MIDPAGGHAADPDHLVETPESLRDSDPEAPQLDGGTQATDSYLAAESPGTTAAEQRHGAPLDARLAQEEPDVGLAGILAVGDPDLPVGRLVADDEGAHPDVKPEAIAYDVGLDGGDRSAEEAAMHLEPGG